MVKDGAEISGGRMPAIEDVKLSVLKCKKVLGKNHSRDRRIEDRLGPGLIDGFQCFDVDNPLWKRSKSASTNP